MSTVIKQLNEHNKKLSDYIEKMQTSVSTWQSKPPFNINFSLTKQGVETTVVINDT
jgi:hypothetical protein